MTNGATMSKENKDAARPAQNTDTKIYQAPDEHEKVYVTKDGRIGINSYGRVVEKSIAEWVESNWNGSPLNTRAAALADGDLGDAVERLNEYLNANRSFGAFDAMALRKLIAHAQRQQWVSGEGAPYNELVWITYVKHGEPSVAKASRVGAVWHNELGLTVIFPVIAWMRLEPQPSPYQPPETAGGADDE